MRMSMEQYLAHVAKNEKQQRGGSKFRAEKTTVDGYTFDSKKEAKRYVELKTLQQFGKISDLKLQVGFDLHVNGFLVCTYRADFVYHEHGQKVIEDCKGYKTDVYRIKKKLINASLGVRIKET